MLYIVIKKKEPLMVNSTVYYIVKSGNENTTRKISVEFDQSWFSLATERTENYVKPKKSLSI